MVFITMKDRHLGEYLLDVFQASKSRKSKNTLFFSGRDHYFSIVIDFINNSEGHYSALMVYLTTVTGDTVGYMNANP